MEFCLRRISTSSPCCTTSSHQTKILTGGVKVQPIISSLSFSKNFHFFPSSALGASQCSSRNIICSKFVPPSKYNHNLIRAASGASGSAADAKHKVSDFKDAFWRFLRPYALQGTMIASIGLGTRVLIENSNLVTWAVLLKALAGLLALSCANSYNMGINQIFDVDIDKINKPELPLAAEDFSVEIGWWLIISFAVVGISIAALLNSPPLLTSLYCLSFLMGTLYSAPPFRMKRFPLVPSFMIALTRGFLLNFGVYHATRTGLGLPFQWSLPMAFITVFVILFAVAIGITKDLTDVEGDRKFEVSNVAANLGVKNITFLGSGILLLNYVGAIMAAIYFPQAFRSSIMIPAHVILAAYLIFQTWVLQQANYDKEAMASFYQIIWKLLYAEYIIFPFI